MCFALHKGNTLSMVLQATLWGELLFSGQKALFGHMNESDSELSMSRLRHKCASGLHQYVMNGLINKMVNRPICIPLSSTVNNVLSAR